MLKHKRLFMVVLALIVIFSSFTVSYATSLEKEFVYQSVDDETGLVETGLPKLTRQTSGVIWSKTYPVDGNTVKEEAIANGHSTLIKQHVRYLTSSWANAASYTWSQSNTATWSFTGSSDVATSVRTTLGLSYSRTTSYSVSVTINADQSKLSKLYFASDFFKQNYKYFMYTNNVVTVSQNSYVKTPLADTYLLIKYK